jgi:hypothetical protein
VDGLREHRIERHRGAIRAGLLLLALPAVEIGVWGTAAPRSFYDEFPGFGHEWVSALAPYNEHLLRDYAASQVGFALLLIAAAVLLERRVVQVTLIALLAGTLPHFIYHLTTTEAYSTFDNVASLGAFVLEIAAALVLLAVARRRPGAGLA